MVSLGKIKRTGAIVFGLSSGVVIDFPVLSGCSSGHFHGHSVVTALFTEEIGPGRACCDRHVTVSGWGGAVARVLFATDVTARDDSQKNN